MKTLWYILAFGISVTLHASLLFFGDPTHTAEVPLQQGHAAVMINLVASVDSQAMPRPSQTEPTPPQQTIPTEMVESILAQDVALAAPVINPADADLPAMTEPVIREMQTQRSTTSLPETSHEMIIKHNVAKIDVSEVQVNKNQPVCETIKKQTDIEKSQQTEARSVSSSNEANTSPRPQGITTEARIPDSIDDLVRTFYPLIYRRRGVEGTVRVEVNIDSNGKANQITVLKSSGHKLMDKAAIKTCRQIPYRPALKNGHPVESIFSHDVVFRLQSDS